MEEYRVVQRQAQSTLSPRSPPQVGSTPGWDRCVKGSASVAAIAPVATGAVALVVVAPVIVVAPVVAAALVIIVTLVIIAAHRSVDAVALLAAALIPSR